MNYTRKLKVFGVFFLNITFLIGIYFYTDFYYKNQYDNQIDFREKTSKYTFINPLLECGGDFKFFNPNSTVSQINAYIDKSITNKKIDDVSYYFRFLKNGSTFGYNENEEFIPASLIKIPLAIGIYKQLEKNPSFLDVNILLDDTSYIPNERYFGKDNIQSGGTYSVYELLVNMLTNSDNLAAYTLLKYLSLDDLYEVYSDLGLEKIDFNNQESLKISPKLYSSFLRILYNASYLNREHSEKILSLLSQSTFTRGIRAGVASDMLISNKFGEKSYSYESTKQLHDCGIVYYPNNPYILCIMTKGTHFENQIEVIKTISEKIYKNISNLR